MASFRVGVAAAAPLRIQVGTPSSLSIEITHVVACGDNATGAASRPQLSRPSTPGTGATPATIVQVGGIGSSSGCTALTSFSGSPSTPTFSSGSFSLPMRMDIRMPRGSGYVVLPSSYILLFADASGGHTWTASVSWEEG